MIESMTAPLPSDPLPLFERPYDWEAIDGTMGTGGGVILCGLLDPAAVDALNQETDSYLRSAAASGQADSGSSSYDRFLGHQTLRLHGLLEKVPSSAGLVGSEEIVDWAKRHLEAAGGAVLINAAELIQIQPGERAQLPHRDSDSWPELPIGPDPFVLNAIVALDPCTLENGATYVAAGSWSWDPARRVDRQEFARAVMEPGDGLIFRGDLVHGGGENRSDSRRRVISTSYSVGWLRTVENSFLNLSVDTVRSLEPGLQELLGFRSYDGTTADGGMLGLYENGDPSRLLD